MSASLYTALIAHTATLPTLTETVDGAWIARSREGHAGVGATKADALSKLCAITDEPWSAPDDCPACGGMEEWYVSRVTRRSADHIAGIEPIVVRCPVCCGEVD